MQSASLTAVLMEEHAPRMRTPPSPASAQRDIKDTTAPLKQKVYLWTRFLGYNVNELDYVIRLVYPSASSFTSLCDYVHVVCLQVQPQCPAPLLLPTQVCSQ